MLLRAHFIPPAVQRSPLALSLRRDWAATLLFLLASAIFLFVDARPDPIILWDESRNIVNALEMRRTGLSLVTTYEFAPDLWNTKPPLLIWLMTGSVALFGASEWSLRLPSAIAALATLLILVLFTRRVTGSLATALLAGTLLTLSPGFFAGHSARTADYDALLTFFTTSYFALLFFAVSKGRPGARLLLLAGFAIACAVLTKSTAGLLPGIGIALYMLLSRRLPRLWATPNYILMAVVAAAPVAAFYLAREAAAPNYLEAVLVNDLFGRFTDSLVGRYEPWYFFIRDVIKGWFFAGPLLFLAPLGWSRVGARGRALVAYSLCVALALLVVVSLSSTKLTHYLLPAYPPLAIATALLLRGLFFRLKDAAQGEPARLVLAIAIAVPVALLVARTGYWRYVSLPALHDTDAGRYRDLFASLSDQGIGRAAIVDPGFHLNDWPNYAPILRSYQLLWAEHGLDTIRGEGAPILASCHPASAARLGSAGSDLAAVPGCIAIAAD